MFILSSAFMHSGKFILIGNPISVKNVERPSGAGMTFNIKKKKMYACVKHYECKECRYIYRISSALKTHQRVHLNLRPCECKGSVKSFYCKW